VMNWYICNSFEPSRGRSPDGYLISESSSLPVR
jgi:hypothetical protein